jgi:DNA-binding FadR family transcriptional regulator
MDLSDNLANDLAGRSDSEPGELPLNRVVRRSASDEVRAQLVGLIESGQLQVNDRLPSEAELSRRFGVSRPIVREALGRLQALGLTESRPGSGTYVASNVTKLTVHFGQYSASDLNEVRRCLEVPAARLAASRRTSQDIDRLNSILGEHERASTAEEVIAFDGQFHCAIASATGNLLFVRLLEDVQERLREQTLAVSTLRNRGAGAAREHRAVVKAIVERDGDAAAAAMEQHLDAVERAIRKIPSDRSVQDLNEGFESRSRSLGPRPRARTRNAAR